MLSVRGGPGPTWGIYAGVITPYPDMLIMCPNVKMVALRLKLKADLLSLCATEDGLREHPIPGLSQSVMWSLLMLCTASADPSIPLPVEIANSQPPPLHPCQIQGVHRESPPRPALHDASHSCALVLGNSRLSYTATKATTSQTDSTPE